MYLFVLFAFKILQPSATDNDFALFAGPGLGFYCCRLLLAGWWLSVAGWRSAGSVFYKSHFQEDLCACQNVDVSQNTRPAQLQVAETFCSALLWSARFQSWSISFSAFALFSCLVFLALLRVLIAAVWELYDFAALNYRVNVSDRLRVLRSFWPFCCPRCFLCGSWRSRLPPNYNNLFSL